MTDIVDGLIRLILAQRLPFLNMTTLLDIPLDNLDFRDT